MLSPKGCSPHYLRVLEFHMRAGDGEKLPGSPSVPSPDIRFHRIRLMLEEFKEVVGSLGFQFSAPITTDLLEPIGDNHEVDLVNVAKEIADLSVTITGTLQFCGLPDEPIYNLVDLSNLSKVRDGVEKNAFGKVLKGKNYERPEPKIEEYLGI